MFLNKYIVFRSPNQPLDHDGEENHVGKIFTKPFYKAKIGSSHTLTLYVESVKRDDEILVKIKHNSNPNAANQLVIYPRELSCIIAAAKPVIRQGVGQKIHLKGSSRRRNTVSIHLERFKKEGGVTGVIIMYFFKKPSTGKWVRSSSGVKLSQTCLYDLAVVNNIIKKTNIKNYKVL